jgi:ribosomal protein S18 acetylase RimI-like enzyme
MSGGGSIVERGGMLFVAGPTTFPVGYSNAALRIDRALPAEDAFEAADAFFAELGRGYTLVAHAETDTDLVEAAAVRNRKPIIESPFMTIEHPVDGVPGDDFDIRAVTDLAGARDLVGVTRQAYADLGMPTEETNALFGAPARLLDPRIHAVVAYLEGRPVSTAMTIATHRAAGVYWVGTAPDARQRGLGERCTQAVTNAGFERGAQVVALEASPMGFPIYERMGFDTVGRVQWYLTPAPGG